MTTPPDTKATEPSDKRVRAEAASVLLCKPDSQMVTAYLAGYRQGRESVAYLLEDVRRLESELARLRANSMAAAVEALIAHAEHMRKAGENTGLTSDEEACYAESDSAYEWAEWLSQQASQGAQQTKQVWHHADGTVEHGGDWPRQPPHETAPRLAKGSQDHVWIRGLDGAYDPFDWKCVKCGVEVDGKRPGDPGCAGRVVRVEPEKCPQCVNGKVNTIGPESAPVDCSVCNGTGEKARGEK